MQSSRRAVLLATTILIGAAASLSLAGSALAQAAAPARVAVAVQEIVVTGSRIKRTATDTAAPVLIVNEQDINDRGYVSANQALNAITSIVPSIPQSRGGAETLGEGASYPNLFNLGAGRTLTLVDGQRMVTTSSGLGDRVVDSQVVPIGLIERIDIVQAGGAAVYGSDAISGVVNYVLKKNFHGVELDAQVGTTSRHDYNPRTIRATAGRNFADGRGNIALNVEWSKTNPLSTHDRPETNPYQLAAPNPADTGPSDGISSTKRFTDAHFYAFNPNGVIFTIPAPVPLPPCGNRICYLYSNNVAQQFTADGAGLTAFNPGTIFTTPFASGGDGTAFADLSSLFVGVERYNADMIGHYDFSDHLRASGSFLYSEVRSTDPLGTGQGGVTNTILNSAATGAGPIAFNRNNGFLSAAQVASLSALSTTFANGGNLILSKQFTDLLPSNSTTISTNSFRAGLSLDGDFDLGKRNFYWTVAATHGEVKGQTDQWVVLRARYNNAINSVKNASGQAICAINAVTLIDTACSPINPFGAGTVSDAARQYVSAKAGPRYVNMQDDLLFTLGGDLFSLPAGAAKFGLSYEHRNESAKSKPSMLAQTGQFGQNSVAPTRGEYNTDEFAAEVLVPVLGGDVTLPFVKALELTGQYRKVDHSLAGKENVWGLGGRWAVIDGVTLRVSRSRNFRAPTLDQLFAPSTSSLSPVSYDPCDARFINAGPAPATRLKNCQALFAANPTYNGGRGLAGYNDVNVNTSGALVTTGGSPTLQNEVSDTTTFGVVLQPRFAPGLTIVADRMQVNILNGLTAYTPALFAQACFDSPSLDPYFCSTFTRNANGDIATATSTTVNAANVVYRGETYSINYRFAPGDLFGGRELGNLELQLETTHNQRLRRTIAGAATETAGTIASPRWVARFDARWSRGPLRLTYEAFYLPETMINRTDTVETTEFPIVGDNLRHSISGSYDISKTVQLRAGVQNLTDERPSYPTTNYGDIIGRSYFAGLKARF